MPSIYVLIIARCYQFCVPWQPTNDAVFGLQSPKARREVLAHVLGVLPKTFAFDDVKNGAGHSAGHGVASKCVEVFHSCCAETICYFSKQSN